MRILSRELELEVMTLRALVTVALLLPGRWAAADMDAARRFYEQAQAEKDLPKRASLLKQSVEAEPTFEACLALGDAQNDLKAYADARQSLKRALELAATDKARAQATYVTAESFLAEGHRHDAVALFRQSIRLHPYPNVVERLKEVELKSIDAPVSAEEIAGALTSTATRSFSVKAAAAPSLDLRIGFASGSADLDAKGLAQVRQLGQALRAPAFGGKTVEIVGHTDKQGDDAANDRLSLRRAESVRALLIREFGMSPSSLLATGRGKRDLLYPGDTENDHALNRRVEVKVH